MLSLIRIDDRTALPPAELDALAAALGRLTTLQDLLRWGFAQRPALAVEEVVVQDEYTHDVVLSWRPGRWLVFDTT